MVLSVDEQRERHRRAVRRFRARETDSARLERLQRDRERHRRVRSTVSTDKENQQPVRESCRVWLDEIPRLCSVSSDTKDYVLHKLRIALGPSSLDEITCAVCDCCKPLKSTRNITINDSGSIQGMRTLLSSDGENLSAALLAEYDCSEMFAELSGILLSRRGVHPDGYVRICEQCYDSLEKQKLPKFAIKNGFYVGVLPDPLTKATLPERLTTQLVSIVAVTRVMRGGAHRSIRSHCLVFDSTPGPAATLLPTLSSEITSYCVVLAGPFTTEQQARIRKMHLVRRKVVEDLLVFYHEHNSVYESINVDCSGIEIAAIPEHLICVEADAHVEVDHVDEESERVGGVDETGCVDGETDVVERKVVFISEDREVNTQDTLSTSVDVAKVSVQNAAQHQFLVRHSSQFAPNDKFLFARMFPHLFPYGRGHPGEERQVPVSLDACIRHYSLLSTRRFAEDELFMLVCFDFVSVQTMYRQVALKCKRNPALFEPYSCITEDSLVQALQQNHFHR